MWLVKKLYGSYHSFTRIFQEEGAGKPKGDKEKSGEGEFRGMGKRGCAAGEECAAVDRRGK